MCLTPCPTISDFALGYVTGLIFDGGKAWSRRDGDRAKCSEGGSSSDGGRLGLHISRCDGYRDGVCACSCYLIGRCRGSCRGCGRSRSRLRDWRRNDCGGWCGGSLSEDDQGNGNGLGAFWDVGDRLGPYLGLAEGLRVGGSFDAPEAEKEGDDLLCGTHHLRVQRAA